MALSIFKGLPCRTCCAELNALLAHFRHRLGEIPLESSHSWTRGAKAVTYARLKQHVEQQHQAGSEMQLLMTAHLLDTIAREQPEAAICKYTFSLQQTCPHWLMSWCLRWGQTSGHVDVLAVDLYPQSALHLAGYDALGYPIHKDMSGSSPVMTLYVPCLA